MEKDTGDRKTPADRELEEAFEELEDTTEIR